MQKLIDTLKSFGIEIPEDKQADVKKALSENYKNTKEVAKTLSKVEGERDNWKERAETAEETLRGFDGIDPTNIKSELETWKQKAADAEKEFNAKIYDRDFSDALKAALDDVKFSSEAAKKSVMADIKEAGLKLKDGKILGLNDLIEQMKQSDASAFVDESQQQRQMCIRDSDKERYRSDQRPVRETGCNCSEHPVIPVIFYTDYTTEYSR